VLKTRASRWMLEAIGAEQLDGHPATQLTVERRPH